MLNRLFTFNRRIARALAPAIARTPLTPNQITVLSMLAGILAAYHMARGSRAGMLFGALCLQISYILDDCDGEIARLKSMQSDFGMWLDYVADLVVDFALWIGLTLGAVAQNVPSGVWALTFLACAGSVMNFLRVVRQRETVGRGQSRAKGVFSSAVATLGDDGDPSLLVWAVALAGYPGWLLFFGALYINFLWVTCRAKITL